MKPNRFQPQVESLEAREVMAGNVMAYVSGGNLIITGDHLDNHVSVYQDQRGFWIVSGRTRDGKMTQINNSYSSATFNQFEVSHDIRVDLNGGNDKLEMNGTFGAADQAIVPDDLSIETDSGADDVILRNVRVADKTRIKMGSGNDYLYMDGVSLGTHISDDPVLDGGSGSDKLYLYNSHIADYLASSGFEYTDSDNLDVGPIPIYYGIIGGL